jgi:2-oxoglutarate ferredoxin oxidoreductase subunit gamma
VKNARRFEIRIAGFGGQGVVTVGKILGTAFTVFEGKNSVNTQSYGPESRGGACRSEVIVSEGRINYPHVRAADVFIALSQPALDTYLEGLKPGGVLVIDPHAVKNVPAAERFAVYEIHTMALARKAGSLKFQNAVALGALLPLLEGALSEDSLRKALAENVPPETLEKNLAALAEGMTYLREHYEASDRRAKA